MFTRRVRLALVGLIITSALIATMLIEAPEGTLAVDDVMKDPDSREGDNLAIRGTIMNGSLNETLAIFTIEGETHTLLIDFSQASLSNALEEGKTIYIEGMLINENDQWILRADLIKVSCPSKYESET